MSIHWFTDPHIRLRNLTETIFRKDKRNSGFAACLEVSHCITDIDRILQTILISNLADVGTFIKTGISITEMSMEIFGESGFFKESSI